MFHYVRNQGITKCIKDDEKGSASTTTSSSDVTQQRVTDNRRVVVTSKKSWLTELQGCLDHLPVS